MDIYEEWLNRNKETMNKILVNPNAKTKDFEKLFHFRQMYQQEQMMKQTRNLVIATWTLAIITIIVGILLR